MTRVAAVDCGTNSLRLLVADAQNGQLNEIVRRMEIVRLGQGVDQAKRLHPAALTRLRIALADYAAQLGRLGVEKVRVVATSAIRDATNADEFHALVLDTLGIAVEVITGEQEAQLTFTGAVNGLRHAPTPWCVIDVGGGSTELVLSSCESHIDAAASVNIGALRLTERCLVSDPPSPTQVDHACELINQALSEALAKVPASNAKTLVGVAGSATTLAAIALGLTEYDRERIHHSRLSAEQIQDITAKILRLPQRQRTLLGAMQPGRAEIIIAGALIFREAMAAIGAVELIVSEHDILDGIAHSIA